MKKLILLSSIILFAAGCNAKQAAQNNRADETVTQSQQQQADIVQKDSVQTSAAPSTPPASQNTQPAANANEFTTAQVAQANSASKCWTIINGKVYDITSYIPKHPGGPEKVLAICGKDGTSLFMGQHGGQEKPNNTLTTFYIGTLK